VGAKSWEGGFGAACCGLGGVASTGRPGDVEGTYGTYPG